MKSKQRRQTETFALVGGFCFLVLYAFFKNQFYVFFPQEKTYLTSIANHMEAERVEYTNILTFNHNDEGRKMRKWSVSRFFNWILRDKKKKSSFRHVTLTKKGYLNTTETRIDFTNVYWMKQFDNIKKTIAKIRPIMPKRLSDWVSTTDGYSKGIFSKTHSIVSNVCLTKRQEKIILHEKEPSILEEAKAYFQDDQFYNNNVTILPKRNKKKEDQFKHVFVLNDHGVQDDYALFDTFSILLRIVIHPEEYPRFVKWIDYNGGLDTNTEWILFFRELVFDLMEDRRPEEINFNMYNEIRKRNRLCDSYMVFLGYWDVQRKGRMIYEPLAVDLLRASAYKRLEVDVHKKKERALKQMVIGEREGGRAIKNLDSLISFLQEQYGSTYSISTLVLAGDSRHVVSVLAMTDVLISVHCSSLVKMVFMTPDSAVILSQPPGYKDFRFKSFAMSVGLQYRFARSNGPTLTECSLSIDEKACQDAVKAYRYSIPPQIIDKWIKSL